MSSSKMLNNDSVHLPMGIRIAADVAGKVAVAICRDGGTKPPVYITPYSEDPREALLLAALWSLGYGNEVAQGLIKFSPARVREVVARHGTESCVMAQLFTTAEDVQEGRV